jgi:hypothetical protein
LTNEDQGEEGIGVEVVVEEETKLVKKIRGQQVSLIDDEEGETIFAGEVKEGIVELREQTGESVSGFYLQGEEDLRVKGSGIEAWVGEVDQGVQIMVKGMDEGSESGRFAGTDIAGNQSGEAFRQSKGQTTLNFLMCTRGEKVIGGDRTTERSIGEIVVIIERRHYRPPVDRNHPS